VCVNIVLYLLHANFFKTAQHKNKLFSTFRLFNCRVCVRKFQLSGIRVRVRKKKAAD
jgi:hypothetical protein